MKSVVTKMSLIMSEFSGVNKDGRNEHSKFDFISYEQLNAIIRPLMAKHNIAIIPNITDYDEIFTKVISRNWDNKKNDYIETEKEMVRTRLKGTVKIIDGETGEMLEFGMVGADQDYGGKSMSKAVTEFDKRALFKAFKVTSKQDIDPDSVTVEKEQPRKTSDTKTDKTPANDTKKPLKSVADENIEKAMKVASVTKERLLEIVKDNFAKPYNNLTGLEKESLVKLIQKEA